MKNISTKIGKTKDYVVEVFRSVKSKKEHYFRIVAKNKKKILSSSGYANRADRDEIAGRIQRAFSIAEAIQNAIPKSQLDDFMSKNPEERKNYLLAVREDAQGSLM